jgi:heme A synthase
VEALSGLQGYLGGSVTRLLSATRDMVNEDLGHQFTLANMIVAAAAICVLWCVDLLQEKHSLRQSLARQKLWLRWLVIFAGLFSVIIFGVYGPGYDAKSFIYEQF